ncbi:hypothetical protein [Chlorobium sp.]|uniref:hypothetical protein n=1 Tax=Chlorobium sp. TaxID=1095 RepID=UPI003C5CCE62
MDQIIASIISIFDPYYIIVVVFGVYGVSKVLERYVPALTPARISAWVVASKNPLFAVIKQDWKKWVTVAIGAGAGVLFVQAGWMTLRQAIPSFLLAEVGYSYLIKYIFTALKIEYQHD